MNSNEVLERMSQPEMFKMWLGAHANTPMVTGMLVYCEGEGFGFNQTGHYVPGNRIQNGYRGHFICRDCAERLYGDKERAAQAILAKRNGADHAVPGS